jgi:hypothetical protein
MKIFVQKSPNLNGWGDSEGIKQYLIVFVCKIGGERGNESERGGNKKKNEKGKRSCSPSCVGINFSLIVDHCLNDISRTPYSQILNQLLNEQCYKIFYLVS